MSNEALIEFIKDTFGSFDSKVTELVTLLAKTPENFSSSLWQLVLSIQDALVAFSYTLLGILLAMELLQYVLRIEKTPDLEGITKIVAKFLFLKVLAGNVFGIVSLCFSVGNEILSAVNVGATNVTLTATLTDSMIEYIETANMGFFDRLMFYMQYHSFGFIYSIMSIIISAIAYLRFLQIYVYVAFSSIPIALVGSEKTRHITIHFIQEFIALLMQGAIMILCLEMYKFLVAESTRTGSIMKMILSTSAVGIVLIMSLFQSNSWARKILGLG